MPLTLSGTNGVSGVDGSASTPSVRGGTSANNGVFYGTNTVSISTNNTTAVTVDSSQNVGIGTATPSSYGQFVVYSAATGAAYAVGGSVVTYMYGSNAGGSGAFGTQSNHPLTLNTNNTERARIDTSGNLLVGTTSAIGSGPQINVCGPTTSRSYVIMSRATAATSGVCGSLQGYNGSNLIASIDLQSNGANNSGYIGTYTWSAGSPVQGPYVYTGGTSWTTPSDERLKDIVGTITNALDKILSLRNIYYTLKSDSTKERRVGWIAQDMLPILPEVVSEKADGELGIQYATASPLLAAAIQELSAKLDAAEARIAALEGAK